MAVPKKATAWEREKDLSLVYTSDWKAKNRVAQRRDKKNRKISIHKIRCATRFLGKNRVAARFRVQKSRRWAISRSKNR